MPGLTVTTIATGDISDTSPGSLIRRFAKYSAISRS
jgi:hypothetical protein